MGHPDPQVRFAPAVLVSIISVLALLLGTLIAVQLVRLRRIRKAAHR